jgi:tetratricopeptide (TPR) repeat protein
VSASDQPESALRLVGALLWFWFSHGSTREGRDLALKALASPSSVQFKKPRARALNTAGFLLYLLGDTGLARQLLEEAISILRESNDEASLAWSLQFLGLVFTNDWKYDLADAAFNEGLALTRNQRGVNANSFLHFQGDIELQKGERSRAKKIYEESVNQLRAIGNKYFLAYPLRRLGYMAMEQNEIRAAQKYFLESLAVNLDVGDKRAIAACLAGLASLSLSLGKPILAARLLGTVLSQLESLSDNLLYLDQLELGRISSRLTTLLDETAFTKAFNEGWELSEEGDRAGEWDFWVGTK